MKKIIFLMSMLVCSHFYARTSNAEDAEKHPFVERIDTDLVWVQDKLNRENLTPESVAQLEKLKKSLRGIQQNVNLLAQYSKDHEALKKILDKEYLPLVKKYISGTKSLEHCVDGVQALEEKITTRLHEVVGTQPLAALAEQHIRKIAEKQREGIMSTEEADLLEKLKKAISTIRHNASLLSSYPDMHKELEKTQKTTYTPTMNNYHANKISLANTVAKLSELAEALEVSLNVRMSDGVKIKSGKGIVGRIRGISESALGSLAQARQQLTRRVKSQSFDSTSYEGLSDSDD